MSRFHSYLANASKLIHSYKPGTPLPFHLKQFFQSEKKYGSKDRKMISSLCYHYFRCFHLYKDESFSEVHLLNSVFLCEKKDNDFLKALSPELNERVTSSIEEKLEYLGFEIINLYGYKNDLSDLIDEALFYKSFLTQPALFLRIRPGRKEKVIGSLNNAQIAYEVMGEMTVRLSNGENVEELLRLNRDAVVQDFSSQHVFDFLVESNLIRQIDKAISVWDTCAASGGKSILLYDLFCGNIKLTVSDIRKNILSNLVTRLQQSGVNYYKKTALDLTKSSGFDIGEKFDVVVCDVPCSGSGTWSRTPEQHFSFSNQQIATFVEKQQSIVSNVLPHVEKNGLFIYITCSVFKSENESMVDYIIRTFNFELLNMNYIKGYENQADTMFVAFFRN